MDKSPYGRHNVRSGLFHYLFGRGMSGLAGVGSVILLARSMDVQNYAGYTALSGLVSMIAIFSGLGMDRAVARFIPEGRIQHSAEQLAGFIWKISILRIMAAIVATIGLYALWSLVLKLFANTLHLDAFPWSVACFLLANVSFDHFSSVLQSLVLQKILTRILVIQWGGRLLLIVVLYYIFNSINLDQAIWIMALPETLGSVVLLLVTRNYLHHLKSDHPTPSDEKEIWPRWPNVLNLALHNYGYNLIVSVPQGYFMRMIAATLLPVDFVAAYGLFLTIIERFRQYLPVQLIYSMMEPILISRYLEKRDFTQLNYHLNIMMNINMYCIIAILTGFSFVHENIISLMSHNDYIKYDWILFILITQLVLGTQAILVQLISNAVGKSYIILLPAIISLIVILLYLLIIVDINKDLIVVAPLLFSITTSIVAILALRMNGYAYSINTKAFIVFIVLSVFLYFVMMNDLHTVYDSIVLYLSAFINPFIVFKVIAAGIIILVTYPLFISTNNIEFIKNFMTKRTNA